MTDPALRLGVPALLTALALVASDAAAIYQSDLVKSVPWTSAPHSTATVDSDTSKYAYALNSFDLKYTSGDHALRRLEYLPVGKKLAVALADQNGDDPIRFAGKHVILMNGIETKETSKTGCLNRCTLQYHWSNDTVFVLAGFDLHRHDGDDKVGEIGIMPDRAKGEIAVTLKGSSHPFDAKVRYALLPKAQIHSQEEAYGSNERDKNSSTIHWEGEYVAANAILILGVKRIQTGNFGTPPPATPLAPTLTSFPTYAQPALQGYWFRFKNGDHYIGEIAVELTDAGACLRFNDQNYDDPFEARLRYALIK